MSSFRASARLLSPLRARTAGVGGVARFHATPRAGVRVGDRVPDLDALCEDSPGNKLNLGRELGDGIIIGVVGAFTPGCSARHIPSYMNHPRLAEAGKVFVVSVNDPFVMKAWREKLDPGNASGIRFLADPSCAFTSALELDFDSTAIFGGPRSRRYALVIKDGKVASTHVEPDNTGTDVSLADKVLG